MTTKSNLPAQTSAKKLATLRDMLEGAKEKLSAVAPKYMSAERMARLVLATASRNPKVLDCTPSSVLLFTMKACELGLDTIGAGGAWPVPYGTELTLLPDYRGKINVARKVGVVKDVRAVIVNSNDKFKRIEGSEPNLVHEPNDEDPGEFRGVYCIITLPDGQKQWEYMSKRDIESIRSRSKAANNGPWKTDYSEMARKTVIHRAMKPFQGASPELAAIAVAEQEAETQPLPELPVIDGGELPQDQKEALAAGRAKAVEAAAEPLPGAEVVTPKADTEGSEMNDGQYLVEICHKICAHEKLEHNKRTPRISGLLLQFCGTNISPIFAGKNPGHESVQLGLKNAHGYCAEKGIEL